MRSLSGLDLGELRAATERGEPVWLDLRDPDEDELRHVGEVLGLHELAVENSRAFGQGPQLDRYHDRLLLVFFGLCLDADGAPCPVEVHIHVVARCVLTISRVPPAQLERVRDSLQTATDCSQGQLVYRVLDAVADSLTDGLAGVATRIDEFERTIFTRPRARDRDRMAVLRRTLNELRRTLGTQREVFARATDSVAAIADDGDDIRPYLTDVADHLRRALDDTEANRDALTGMLETYSNEIQERLTIVATIFLPLTSLTGFFGMNFNWMVDHVGSAWTFFGLGLGGLMVSCVLIVAWLRRTGLLARVHDEE